MKAYANIQFSLSMYKTFDIDLNYLKFEWKVTYIISDFFLAITLKSKFTNFKLKIGTFSDKIIFGSQIDICSHLHILCDFSKTTQVNNCECYKLNSSLPIFLYL